jgi:signal transduction histidine kinase
MKRKFSLSLKLTLIVVCVSAIIVLSLTYINIQSQADFFESNYSEKGATLAHALNAGLRFQDEVTPSQELQSYILNVTITNPELLHLSINLPDNQGRFIIIASSDTDEIGSNSGPYQNISYEKASVVYIPLHTTSSHKIKVIAPLNLSGQILGTYEMLFSMDNAYALFDAQMRTLIGVTVFSLFILIFTSLYLLRRAIVKPIITFRNAAKMIGEGNLDAKITILSKDELGELADAFNAMAADLKKSRRKIEKYNKTLERLLDQKDEFIGQLGHDLKNPLTPLVGLLPMIADQEKDPTIKEHLNVIIHNVEYMRDLILKTLQLARLRSPNTKFDFENISLKKEVQTIVENLRLFLKDHHMKIINNIQDDLVVKADKLRLTELFNNLITNSVKYTPNEGGSITFDAKENDKMVTISVRDTGIGMTKEQLEQIFDEFYKADASRHEMDSSGLGLSICKRIVQRHGGKIWVDSPGPGKGSTFYFTLKKGDETENVSLS